MIQKIVLVIMAVTSIFSNATAQDQEWKPELFYGLSAGQENFFFGLPKISLKLANTKPKLKPYIGSDLGLWIVFATGLSANAHVGIQHNIFIAEAGIGKTWYGYSSPNGSSSNHTNNHTAIKFGIAYRSILIKAGPSFMFGINDNNYKKDFMAFKNIPMNVSILFKHTVTRSTFRNYKRLSNKIKSIQ